MEKNNFTVEKLLVTFNQKNHRLEAKINTIIDPYIELSEKVDEIQKLAGEIINQLLVENKRLKKENSELKNKEV